MAHAGQIIENPVTGERCKWHLTAADTDGRMVRLELWVRPGGGSFERHIHPRGDERFEILSGCCELTTGNDVLTLGPGDRGVVRAGVPHRWHNPHRERTLHCFVELDAPGAYEAMVATLFGLARDGRVDRRGRMRTLQHAVSAPFFAPVMTVDSPRARLLDRARAPLATLGRVRGLQPVYTHYEEV